jgi:hypothetical protein
VFVTGPFEDESNNGEPSVAIVPISSTKNGWPGDPTCTLDPGCHEFITKESWVNYREAKIRTCTDVAAGVADGRIALGQGPMLEEPLRKLLAGVCKSPDTPRRVKLEPVAKRSFATG